MASITVSLPEPMKAYVEEQIQAGKYGNVSEYFRSLVREAQHREADRNLEELLLKGLQSGTPIEGNGEFWTDLKAEANRLLTKSRPKAS